MRVVLARRGIRAHEIRDDLVFLDFRHRVIVRGFATLSPVQPQYRRGLGIRLVSHRRNFFTFLAALIVASPDTVSYGRMHEVLHGGDENGGPVTFDNVIRQYACWARQQLGAIGIEIINDWGRGYSVSIMPVGVAERLAA